MSDDSVPVPQMHQRASTPDPLDAVLRGDDQTEDLLDVANLAHLLRTTYRPTQPLEPSPDLRQFTGSHRLTADRSVNDADADAISGVGAGAGALVNEPPPMRPLAPERARAPATPTSKRPLIIRRLAGFIGTLTGKIVLGATVAAASMGVLDAAEVVDMPVPPPIGAGADDADSTETSATTSAGSGTTGGEGTSTSDGADTAGADSTGLDSTDSVDGPSNADVPNAAVGGQTTAQASSAAAEAFTVAIQAWADCVADAAPRGNRPDDRGPDRSDECGQRPEPADFGLTDVPDAAEDAPGNPPASGSQPTSPTPGPPGNPTVTPSTGSADPTNQATTTKPGKGKPAKPSHPRHNRPGQPG